MYTEYVHIIQNMYSLELKSRMDIGGKSQQYSE